MFKTIKNIHFVGIGGSGMSGIAEVLINLGYKVSGSDMKSSDVTERLARLGARIGYGHKESNVGDAQGVNHRRYSEDKEDVCGIAPEDVADCQIALAGYTRQHAYDELRRRCSECDNGEPHDKGRDTESPSKR